jgi:hypothetical protein
MTDMKFRAFVLFAVMLSFPVSLYAMDANTFYLKAAALKKKGMGAMMSSDLKPVMNEIQAAGKSVKAENEKAKAAGKPLYCPPAKPGMNQNQVLAEFARIPAARRKAMTTRAAWREILIRRYPC